MTSPKDVAGWMLSELQSEGVLYQESAVYQIVNRYGEQFTYHNENGNLAIRKEVLNAFRRISNDYVVWSRADRCWRMRGDGDLPGRMQP